MGKSTRTSSYRSEMSEHIWIDEWLPHGISVKKCECGTSIALGKDDDPMFHSEWCPINPNYKEKEEK